MTTIQTQSEPSTLPRKYTATLAQILSITTGRLVCEMGGVYEILNAITGDNLFTHVLPRASKFAAPIMLAKYPELNSAGTPHSLARLSQWIDDAKHSPGDDRENCNSAVKIWLEGLGLPDSYEIECHSDTWMSLDPVKEAEAMVGKNKVIVI